MHIQLYPLHERSAHSRGARQSGLSRSSRGEREGAVSSEQRAGAYSLSAHEAISFVLSATTAPLVAVRFWAPAIGAFHRISLAIASRPPTSAAMSPSAHGPCHETGNPAPRTRNATKRHRVARGGTTLRPARGATSLGLGRAGVGSRRLKSPARRAARCEGWPQGPAAQSGPTCTSAHKK
jgi:hypothetical protein